MNAQFATIEAILAFLVVLTAVTFISLSQSLFNSQVYNAKSNLSEAIALYDLSNEILKNSTTGLCISSINTNASCAYAITKIYQEIYGVNIEIYSKGVTVGNAEAGRTVCMLAKGNVICITSGE